MLLTIATELHFICCLLIYCYRSTLRMLFTNILLQSYISYAIYQYIATGLCSIHFLLENTCYLLMPQRYILLLFWEGYRHTFATVFFVATELHVQAVWQPGVCGVRQATAQHSSSVVWSQTAMEMPNMRSVRQSGASVCALCPQVPPGGAGRHGHQGQGQCQMTRSI